MIDPAQRPIRSSLEDAFRRFCKRHRLPLPEINAVLPDLKDREVDAFYREERLIVEIDSYPYHRDLAIFTRDRRKDSAALARGYATVRIPETEFDHDGTEQAKEIRAILADRRPRP